LFGLIIDNYQKAEELNEYDYLTYYRIGFCYLSLGVNKNAIEYFKYAVEFNPKDERGVKRPLHLLIGKNMVEDSAQIISDFVVQYPGENNISALQFVFNIFGERNDIQMFLIALSIMENKFSDQELILAGIYYYKGVCNEILANTDTAKEYWIKSKNLYLNLFDESHAIIQKINELPE
jgi:tetratricopeptide (TPR) repeat protein